MTDCNVKMPPEGKEVLVKLGSRFAIAYWLKVDGKPYWLPGAAVESNSGNGCELVSEPTEWSYLPSRITQATQPAIVLHYNK